MDGSKPCARRCETVLARTRMRVMAARPEQPALAPKRDSRVRAMLVDDDPMWRATLRRVLEASGTAQVVAEASDGDEALTKAQAATPDVVGMDIALPKIDGIETTR